MDEETVNVLEVHVYLPAYLRLWTLVPRHNSGALFICQVSAPARTCLCVLSLRFIRRIEKLMPSPPLLRFYDPSILVDLRWSNVWPNKAEQQKVRHLSRVAKSSRPPDDAAAKGPSRINCHWTSHQAFRSHPSHPTPSTVEIVSSRSMSE